MCPYFYRKSRSRYPRGRKGSTFPSDRAFIIVEPRYGQVLAICGFIFPIMELSASLAGKVLLTTDNPGIRRFYSKSLASGLLLYSFSLRYFQSKLGLTPSWYGYFSVCY